MQTIHYILAFCLTVLIGPAFVAPAAAAAKVQLAVPYVSEAPGNNWTGSWKNACEEASIAMLQYFYMGKSTETVEQSKTYMRMLFNKERALWGSDANSDAKQTLRLIADYSSFNARIVEAPTLKMIKAELDGGRPVIVPLDGFSLKNKNIPFLRTGSGYHMFVIIGYDDAKSQFIVNDTGDNIDGVAHRYDYDVLMDAIHDYVASHGKADGPARALFTFPKLAKTATSHRIYYLSGNTKQYVTAPAVFAQKKWTWDMVRVMPEKWLRGLDDGLPIKP